MSEHMSYVGRYECGCIQSAVVDNPAHRADVRREVSRFMRQGATIERMTTEEVRAKFCLRSHPKDVCPCAEDATCPSR
jgi:hypothetical protein